MWEIKIIMPNLDKTGPRGQGSKTGRGAGDCDGNDSSKKQSGMFNRLRRGCGCACGCGRRFFQRNRKNAEKQDSSQE